MGENHKKQRFTAPKKVKTSPAGRVNLILITENKHQRNLILIGCFVPYIQLNLVTKQRGKNLTIVN